MQSQIKDLQVERAHLLHRLRESSTQISEKGIRFVGLSPEHLDMVRSFANQVCNANLGTSEGLQKQIRQPNKRHDGVIHLEAEFLSCVRSSS